jgi:small-conductance mechanosensitive channel
MTFDPNNFLIPSVISLVSLIGLLFVRTIAFRALKKWLSLTPLKIDLIILKSLRMPSVFWCIAGALYIGVDSAELTTRQAEIIHSTLIVLLMFSFSLALANLVGRLFKNYTDSLQIPVPSTGLFYALLKGTIIAIGLVIIMSYLGVSIAPLLTALGVGGLAVALALKDTLENLFAGIHILIEKTIRVGDFIRLENGQEGTVEDITWRTTRIRMLQNNTVIIPNSKLSQSIVLNYSLPEDKMNLQVPVSVSYNADPEKVEKILIDEANRAKGEVEGLCTDFDPVVRFNPGFGESSLDFTLVCQIDNVRVQFAVLHELRKRIFRRFKEEGIEIPFPQRVLHVKRDQ